VVGRRSIGSAAFAKCRSIERFVAPAPCRAERSPYSSHSFGIDLSPIDVGRGSDGFAQGPE
jgi:hypothetical protein